MCCFAPGSESPETGGPVFGNRGVGFTDDYKGQQYEMVVRRLERIHGVTPSERGGAARTPFSPEAGGGDANMVEISSFTAHLKKLNTKIETNKHTYTHTHTHSHTHTHNNNNNNTKTTTTHSTLRPIATVLIKTRLTQPRKIFRYLEIKMF